MWDILQISGSQEYDATSIPNLYWDSACPKGLIWTLVSSSEATGSGGIKHVATPAHSPLQSVPMTMSVEELADGSEF